MPVWGIQSCKTSNEGLSEMYLVGSIPLLVYRRDTASRCVTPFF